ncbi:hypothetical protein [Mucilaginibacter jinjuensis]|uniref:Uncharacterized protein n=1 Tax=Mucilaginibacter jinjuensis TaxID=1176721 RepID=A0ABY7T5I7_9SPHI|nr:hypothetical protein [Mucilaginibacter jinjuensis]WCT11538.1 hypothetical protein PQO05_22620 [Mucilaginibacter jinjuensis]
MLIDAVEFVNEDLYLTFSIRFYGNVRGPVWKVTVSGVEEELIKRSWSQNIGLYTEHPLLLEYTDPYRELYLNGTTEDALDLFIDINRAVSQLSNDSEDISRYLFSYSSIAQLSKQGHGLFASGPKTILTLHAECLSRYGIKPIFIGDKDRGSNELKLFKLGYSYVIGRDFLFEKL